MADKITLEQVLAEKKVRYDHAVSLVSKKGADYNRKQQEEGDTLFNMRVSTILGVDKSPSQAVMGRIVEKMMRLCSLYDAEVNPQVKDESFEDTVDDIHNFIDYLVLFRREQIRKLGVVLSSVDGGAHTPPKDVTDILKVTNRV